MPFTLPSHGSRPDDYSSHKPSYIVLYMAVTPERKRVSPQSSDEHDFVESCAEMFQ